MTASPPASIEILTVMDDFSRPSWQRDDNPYREILRPYARAATTTSNGGRPWPELWDISNGCILWLPPRREIKQNILAGTKLSSKPPGFFDHPIVVLKVEVKNATTATILFAKMTTRVVNGILPVFPADPDPKSGIQLRTESESWNRGMKEGSYVSVGEGIFALDWTTFRCYAVGQKGDGYRHRLQQESFAKLRDQSPLRMEGESTPWTETNRLWETFIENYVANGIQLLAEISPVRAPP